MKCGTLEFSYLINQITTHTTSRISWTGSECKSNMLKGSLFWSLSPDSLWKFFEHTINKEKNIMACKNLPWGFVISHSNSREGSCVIWHWHQTLLRQAKQIWNDHYCFEKNWCESKLVCYKHSFSNRYFLQNQQYFESELSKQEIDWRGSENNNWKYNLIKEYSIKLIELISL